MSKKAEDMIEEIFVAAGADDDARALETPLRQFLKEAGWTAEGDCGGRRGAHESK